MTTPREGDTIDWGTATRLDDLFAVARGVGRPLTVAEAEYALGRIGRKDRPALLFDLFYTSCIPWTMAAMAALVVPVWSVAEWPSANVPRRIWIEWFRMAAYPHPAAPIGLYRGATPPYARGMSWTTDSERAQWFADRWSRTVGATAHVYTVLAPPAAILADVDAIEGEGGRMEGEIVVDPAKLPRLARSG